MNIAKAALYLEYIAWLLRWHYAPETIPGRKKALEKKVAKTRETQDDHATERPIITPLPEENPAEFGQKPRRRPTDPVILMTDKIDRLIEQIPVYHREWVLRWLLAKYPLPRQADPNV